MNIPVNIYRFSYADGEYLPEVNYTTDSKRLMDDIKSCNASFFSSWYDSHARAVQVSFRVGEIEICYTVERASDFAKIVSVFPDSADLIASAIEYRDSFNN